MNGNIKAYIRSSNYTSIHFHMRNTKMNTLNFAIGSIVDVNTGIIMACPNLPLFRQVPLKDMVSKRMGTPAIIENDANVACWAEYVNGAGKEVEHMIMLTLGTGIGGGIICDGRLIHGPTGGAAELGHMIIEIDGRPCGCGQRVLWCLYKKKYKNM